MTRLLAVYDGNNALVMRFEYADARMPFAMTMSGATYFLAYDQVGSLRVVADGSGNPVKRTDYDSFGNVFSDSDPNFAVPFGFAGGLHDKDTKFVRFGFRDYDPDTGRWTANDPIGFNGGDSDLYGYCVNDPVNWADFSGYEPYKSRYPTADDAATAALGDIYDRSRQENREYGGWIFQRSDGSYSYTEPGYGPPMSTGNTGGMYLPPEPLWWTTAASYHSHGDAYGPGRELFSDGSGSDIELYENSQKTGYIVTPSGVIKVYIPSAGLGREGMTIGHIPCQ